MEHEEKKKRRERFYYFSSQVLSKERLVARRSCRWIRHFQRRFVEYFLVFFYNFNRKIGKRNFVEEIRLYILVISSNRWRLFIVSVPPVDDFVPSDPRCRFIIREGKHFNSYRHQKEKDTVTISGLFPPPILPPPSVPLFSSSSAPELKLWHFRNDPKTFPTLWKRMFQNWEITILYFFLYK